MPRLEALPPRRMQSRLVVREREQRAQLACGVRQKRREQTRKRAYDLKQMMQHFTHPSLPVRIFNHGKRGGLDDVAIGVIESRPNSFKRPVKLQLGYKSFEVPFRLGELIPQRP